MPRTGKREKIARPFARDDAVVRAFVDRKRQHAQRQAVRVDHDVRLRVLLVFVVVVVVVVVARLCSGAGFGDERVRPSIRAASRDTAATPPGSSARTAARRTPGGSRASRGSTGSCLRDPTRANGLRAARWSRRRCGPSRTPRAGRSSVCAFGDHTYASQRPSGENARSSMRSPTLRSSSRGSPPEIERATARGGCWRTRAGRRRARRRAGAARPCRPA